jgi:predicted transcriptional regulator
METDTKQEAMTSYTLQIPVNLKQQLDEQAKAEDRTTAALVRRLLTKAMEAQK